LLRTIVEEIWNNWQKQSVMTRILILKTTRLLFLGIAGILAE
jgi:hypothetical protein